MTNPITHSALPTNPLGALILPGAVELPSQGERPKLAELPYPNVLTSEPVTPLPAAASLYVSTNAIPVLTSERGTVTPDYRLLLGDGSWLRLDAIGDRLSRVDKIARELRTFLSGYPPEVANQILCEQQKPLQGAPSLAAQGRAVARLRAGSYGECEVARWSGRLNEAVAHQRFSEAELRSLRTAMLEGAYLCAFCSSLEYVALYHKSTHSFWERITSAFNCRDLSPSKRAAARYLNERPFDAFRPIALGPELDHDAQRLTLGKDGCPLIAETVALEQTAASTLSKFALHRQVTHRRGDLHVTLQFSQQPDTKASAPTPRHHSTATAITLNAGGQSTATSCSFADAVRMAQKAAHLFRDLHKDSVDLARLTELGCPPRKQLIEGYLHRLSTESHDRLATEAQNWEKKLSAHNLEPLTEDELDSLADIAIDVEMALRIMTQLLEATIQTEFEDIPGKWRTRWGQASKDPTVRAALSIIAQHTAEDLVQCELGRRCAEKASILLGYTSDDRGELKWKGPRNDIITLFWSMKQP